jgi:hypothetical protein
MATPTPGGTRIIYTSGISDMRLYATTLEVKNDLSGTPVGTPEDNTIITTTPQTGTDGSGTQVAVPAGTTVQFPPNAPQVIQITTPISPVSTPQVPPTVDAIPVIREFGPAGTQFNPPITISISYTDAEIEGLVEASLRVFLYNEISGIYDIEVPVEDIVERDLENNVIRFNVSHFSVYGLGAEMAQPVPAVSPELLALILLLVGVGALCIKRSARVK